MADAVFDEQLRARLMAFQKANGLPVDGKVDSGTWTKLAVPAEQPKVQPQSSEQVTKSQPGALVQATTTQATVAKRPGADAFPTLMMIATKCKDEAGVRAFLKEHLGVDLDAFEREMDAALAD